MVEFIFWACVVAATYSYFWYPALLMVLPSRKMAPSISNEPVRRVAIIIAARNEAAKISAKLDNTLALDRANVELDVIVASDASDDATDDVVRTRESQGVRLVRSHVREGKEYAQGLAIAATDADVIVFTDVGTILPADAITHLLAAFSNPGVGAVSSVDRFIAENGSLEGEGAYVRYEMWLRDLETRFFSLVGLSGSFFAARRRVCQQWDNRIPSDFGTALNCARLGMRAISDREVVGYYKNLADPSKEYRRKVRTVMRGMNGLLVRREVLDFCKYGRFAFQLFSHKVMRWAAPWFLIGAMCANILLAPSSRAWQALLIAQAAMYISPLASSLVPALRRIGVIRICVYFVEVNAAMFHAAVLVLSGRTMLVWEPSRR